MTADYKKELSVAIDILRKLRLPVNLIRYGGDVSPLDSGFRKNIGMQAEYETAVAIARLWADGNTIYKMCDRFRCGYFYFILPDDPELTYVVVGPYLTDDLSHDALLELSEQLGLDMKHFESLVEHFASMPVYTDPTVIMAVLTALAEVIYGGPEAFSVVDVNIEQLDNLPPIRRNDMPIEQDNILERMEQLEKRYAYEDELMETVARGLTQQAEQMLASVSQLSYQKRTHDLLRNMKNYCIICNTLLRKAAQNGGVHPLHLDRISSQYAQRTDSAATTEQANSLIIEMIRNYCRLVHSNSTRQYSAIVQKTMTYIDANLSGDLSLNMLAELMSVSPGYLSTIFHRETGATLADHISTRRMRAALHMLKTTRLQIQSIAQLSGYSDPNYFSKLFKRFYGITPQQYRKGQSVLPQD